jgi:hypothetical protein
MKKERQMQYTNKEAQLIDALQTEVIANRVFPKTTRGNDNAKNIAKGLIAGVLLSIALFAPLLVTIETATPNGINVYVGDYGYHFEGSNK